MATSRTRFKVQVFFAAQTGLDANWSEVMYISETDGLNSAMERVYNVFLPRRLDILQQDYAAQYIRVTDVDVVRSSRVLGVAAASGSGRYREDSGPGLPEDPFLSLLCRAEAGSLHRRSFFLKGLPQGILTHTRNYVETNATWNSRFDRFVTMMTAATGFNPQIKTRTVGDSEDVSGIAVGSDKHSIEITFSGGVPSTISDSDGVLVKGVQGAAPVNGLWRYRSSTGSTAVMEPRRRVITGAVSSFGSVQGITYDLARITSLSPEEGREKKVGHSPYSPLHGRRSTR